MTEAVSELERLQRALAAAEQRQADLEQRLLALVAASGTLFGSPTIDDVLPGVVLLARTLIPADGYALWRFDVAAKRWHIGASAGVSETFTDRIVGTYLGDQVSTIPFSEPLVAESVHTVPMLAERVDAYRAEGIESMLAVPLQIAGHATGTLVFYFRTRHEFSDIEVQTSRALANLAAAAITTAELYELQQVSRERAELANRQAAFLSEASAALGSSLDYAATLRTVAELAVPHIADWCAVDIVDEQGRVQRLAVAHVDPARIELARTLQDRYPDDPDARGGIRQVIRTATPMMYPAITDAMLVASARDPEHLRAMRALSIASVIMVPLAAHGRTFGALTFVHAESGRTYTDADFRFLQDVAYRSALAVENARAYAQVNAANRAKDEFLATLSHELRTPLNAVLGWSRMLRDGTISPGKMPRALEVIERNAVAQLDLVEDLLDLSRIITGKFRLNVGPVDLEAAIAAAIEAIQPAAAAKGITIAIGGEDGSGVMIGDGARLQQAVWNLLANAIKFTPAGGRVAVSRQRRDADIEIEVADNGEGIDPAVLPFVFDRFRQADSGTTRTHMGLGLGLAIVRHIVELHGGRVSVTSGGKGQGSTFRLSLPMVPVQHAAVADPGRTRDSAPNRATPVLLTGLRILIVDDDQDARELITEVLRSRGAEVTAAASAADAREAFDREPPDVMLSDIAMPGHDGLELIRAVRGRPAAAGGRVPAIALTAYARDEDRERSLVAGFDAHMAKPVDLDALVTTVARLAKVKAKDART
ncbi:MAG: domain S-box [Acidobacteria bacterium]|nr:domain S-box [Acidobacteriota bacterium]